MTVTEIKNKIRKGDMGHIAEIVGCSLKLIDYILRGERNADTPKGRKIIEVATQIIQQRETLKQEYQNQ